MKIFMRVAMSLFLLCAFAFAQKKEALHILILQSYHETLPWSKQVMQGLSGFEQNFEDPIEFYVESIDYFRLKDSMSASALEEYFLDKYKNIKFDGIIVDSLPAANLFNKIRDKYYKETPTIYYPTYQRANTDSMQSLVWIDEGLITNTISMIENHHPNLENIYVIEPESKDFGNKKILMKQLHKTKYTIKMINFNTIDELKNTLSKISPRSAVFYIMNSGDKKGYRLVPMEFLKEISPSSTAPIYSFWSTFIGAGTVGGYMIDGEKVIQNVLASLIHKIQKGEFLKDIKSYFPIVDYEMLQKYKISVSQNPQDTLVLNRPIPIWESYPQESAFAVVVIILLLVIIVIGVVLRVRTQKIIMMEETMLIQSKQAQMGEMINAIAHQLKQPIYSLSSMIQTIVFKHEKSSLSDDFVQKCKEQSSNLITYMSTTIDDFKDFHKPNREKKVFSVEKTMQKMLNIVQQICHEERISITKNFTQDCFVNGYENELEHCFLIILSNAKDAMSSIYELKKKQIFISIERDASNRCVVAFENSGEHIAEDLIGKIFEPYVSTKKTQGGTGVGLYIAKKIITTHFDGKISAKNVKDGVRFEIILPINKSF